jgi:SpoVK/Ycf46/Vps4 family AAA+-type ATPase
VQLPPHDKTQLERLVAHARQRSTVLAEYGFEARAGRGLGLAALFHGESGTGKTLAAEAVANALAQSLFRIDLSAVVSKYIGETSKNLRRVFDAAEGGGAVLLFDEADAVFGKRSEVKDSHDRYANIDINYLLTRMESFGGVAILATNMKHALDPAFVRRLRFVVGFPFPGVPERRSIWARVFPDVSRLDAADPLDLDRLARFALTGGSIFNAALAAAHGAASEREPIGMRHVLDAIRWELRKMERPVAESEFGWRAQPGVREAR